jgi:hypothetical protein
MRSTVVLPFFFVVAAALCATARADAGDASGNPPGPRHKAIAAGNMAINPTDIIAVYRPFDQQAVALYIGRPGQAIQAIIIKDQREAANVFKDIWDNAEVTKDPGEDDARPLTRMRPKDTDRASATLIVNVQRILAVSWDADHRRVHVYLDKLLANETLTDPNGDGDGAPYLEVQNIHDAAEAVMAAYKACILRK